jgi:hypothetical protein
MKIPFAWLPASWGLRGKSRQIAEAEYLYSGYELDRALVIINHVDPIEQESHIVDIDLKHSKIDQYEADRRKTRLALPTDADDKSIELAMLDIDLKHSKISAAEHERKRADLTGEPFMAMPKISWDPVDPSKTYFELDYNEHFVKYLMSSGYAGTEEDVINRWLNDVCASILDEMATTEPEFVRTVRTIRRDDGKTEHS